MVIRVRGGALPEDKLAEQALDAAEAVVFNGHSAIAIDGGDRHLDTSSIHALAKNPLGFTTLFVI